MGYFNALYLSPACPFHLSHFIYLCKVQVYTITNIKVIRQIYLVMHELWLFVAVVTLIQETDVNMSQYQAYTVQVGMCVQRRFTSVCDSAHSDQNES